MSSQLRVTRLEPSGAGGWWISFSGDLFADAVAFLRTLPEHQRRYVPGERAWWLSSGALHVVCEALPDVERAFRDWLDGATDTGPTWERGRTSSTGTRRGSRSRSERAPVSVPRAIADALDGVPEAEAVAFAELSLLPSASPQLVKSARRIAAQRRHPDHRGGSHAGMLKVNAAHDRALAWAESHEQEREASAKG